MVIMSNTPILPSNLTNITSITTDISQPLSLLQIILNPVWIIQSVFLLIAAYIIVWMLDFGLKVLSEQLGTKRHILSMIIPVLKVIIYLLTVLLIISPLLNLGMGELAIISGLLGAGIGFGLKDLFADIVAGFLIIIEKPYQIGDKIQIDNDYGEVVDIGIIQTIIVTPGDSRVAIPNYAVISRSVSSANAGSAEMMIVIEFYLSYDSDLKKATTLLTEAVITSRYVYVSGTRPYTILVESHPLYRKLIAKAYVNDLRHEFVFRTDVIRRTWEVFKDEGIKPPDITHITGPVPISYLDDGNNK